MNLRSRMQNFNKRWNIEYDEKHEISKFKGCVITITDEVLGELFLKDKQLLRDYFLLIGKPLTLSQLGIVSLTKAFQGETFKDSPVYSIFTEETRLENIIFYIQALFWLNIGSKKEMLYEKLKKIFDLLSLNINIKKIKNSEYILYPAGAKLLDEGVVNDVIDWLSQYPESYDKFKSALQKYQEHKYKRNLIDDLRFSLEELLKNILNSEKNLENQKALLGDYLEKKDIPKEIRNFYSSLIQLYGNYQNKRVKHKDKAKEIEIELMIYLTGTLMRFLLSL